MPLAARDSLALVTVTHNSARDLEAMLRSADRHLPGVRVIVVDCASVDDSVALARAYGAVTVASSENVGFGSAGNRGLREVREPVTALLNPDVELVDDSLLAIAAEAARTDAPARLLAPLVLNPDGSRQDTVHPAPGSAAELLRTVLPPTLMPGRLGIALAPWRSPVARPVGWAVGCAIVARTETLRDLGPFDERIFMFSEDLDLGLHAAQRGVTTWFWPLARVVHHQSHSTGPAYGGEPFAVLARARRDVIARRAGPARAALDDAAQVLTFATRIAAKRARRRPADRERRQLHAVIETRRAARSRG